MKKTRYNLDFIFRLTDWAHILAWVFLCFSILGGLGYVGVSIYDIWHPERLANLYSDSQGYGTIIFQQIVNGIQVMAGGFATFIFLKAMSQVLYVLVDFEENTRPDSQK